MDVQIPTTTGAGTRVALCVLTYLRPVGLARLLSALAQLEPPDPKPELRLVVVDNDPEGSGRAVCAELGPLLPFPLSYQIEKRRGIAQARNAALAACLGDSEFVVFLDDDEVPEPAWLAELLRTQRETGADAVTGPCLSRFEVEPPAWIEAAEVFVRPRWRTGQRVATAYTGNVLIRTGSLAAMDALFDERLGLIGSEDTEFFQRFLRAGNCIVWCDTAVIHDEVPATCANLSWILARAYRSGASTAYIARKLDPGAATPVRILAHGGWCLAKAAALLVLALWKGRAAAAQALQLGSFGAGRIGGLAGLHHSEYRVIHGS